MQEDNERRILAALYRAPDDEKSLRELERETGLSVMTVAKAVQSLEHKHVVTTRKRPHAKLVKVDTEHDDYRWRKRLVNIEELYASGFVDALREVSLPKATILFGSFGRGSDDSKSDIDICVIEPTNIRHDWKDFEKKLGKPINLTIITKESQPSRSFLAEIANGYVLQGYYNPWSLVKDERKDSMPTHVNDSPSSKNTP